MSLYVPPRPAPVVKAGPIGPGAGVLNTEFLLPSVLSVDPRQGMRRAVQVGIEVAYIRKAEQVISSRIADPLLGVGWHLEDPQGETIDDEYPDSRAVEAYALVARPMANLRDATTPQFPVRSREEIWEITSRHMGLAGQGAWYLDRLNDFGIPSAIAYIRPDRLEPKVQNNTVQEWLLDKRPGYAGTPLDADEVLLVQFQTPDDGVWAPGLVESAYAKARLNGAVDTHFAQVLAGGGRISGILSPKQGAIEDDAVFNQMIRDWRNVTEQPESARRLQVVRAPIDFTKTILSPDEMKLIDLMGRNRDDLLAIWGVPLSQIGGATPAGLNSGDVRKYDKAALWENAVTPRLSRFNAAIQGLLDRYKDYLGWAPKIIFDIPEFDDDSPRYDKVQKAQFITLTNDERRELLGRPPLSQVAPKGMEDEYARRGAEIIMSNTQVPYDQLGQAPAGSFSGAPSGPPGAKAKDLQSLDQGKQKGPEVVAAVLATLKKQWPANQLDVVKQGSWKYDPAYPLAKIDAARRPIARNPKIVAGVEAALNVGAPIDPVVLINIKRLGTSDKPTEPIDGWHRLLAAEHAGLDTIPAYIGKGDDAWTKTLIGFDDQIPTPSDSYGKAAFTDSMKVLRSGIEQRVTPQIASSVRRVLEEQKRDVIARVRSRFEQIKSKPNDTSLWWKAPNGQRDPWNTALSAALQPHLQDVAQTVTAHVKTQLRPGEAKAVIAPAGAVAHVLSRGAARVTKINQTTREGLQSIIADGIDEGMGPAELGDAIEAWSGWDEYRAERIATTELMDAYNAAALGSYDELGVEMVEAIDGDGDEECAARDGQTFTLDEADQIEDHPNGTLDWVPVLPEEEGKASFAEPVPEPKITKSQQLQTLIDAVTRLSEYRPEPVTFPEIPAPIVNVPAPIVNVAAQPAPIVNVTMPKPGRKVISRDKSGNYVITEKS